MISTSFINNHTDFDLFFSSSFEKVTTFSKMELKYKSKNGPFRRIFYVYAPPTIIDYTTGDDLRLISPSKGIFEAVMGGFWNIGPSWY